MAKRLFLLDGMALVYRAHFAFAGRPIRTSAGVNTSALYGFINTLLDILQTGEPTHLAVAFDTDAPTPRHHLFTEYKAQRQAMPEELSAALPHVRRVVEAFRIPALVLDGYEADDLIGTLVKRAEPEGFESFMVTADKDFGQLVSERTWLWKPGRQGGEVEVLGPVEVCARWGIARVDQVVDMLGLMGDTSDNIPGVPGVGEKTAARLLAQFGTLEAVLAHAGEIKGKLGEAIRTHADTALLSKKLATIITDVPIPFAPEDLLIQARDDDALRDLCIEFEFNALGRRLYGDAFKAGRGFASAKPAETAVKSAPEPAAQGDLFADRATARPRKSGRKAAASTEATSPAGEGTGNDGAEGGAAPATATATAQLKTLADVPHHYVLVGSAEGRHALIRELSSGTQFCFATTTEGYDPKTARLMGLAFSSGQGRGWYVTLEPEGSGAGAAHELTGARAVLREFAGLFSNRQILKIGHDLKRDLLVLRWNGLRVEGPCFDTLIAHALVDPDLRHGLEYLSEALLGYSPVPLEKLVGAKGPEQKKLGEVPLEARKDWAVERVDVAWQLRERLLPMLKERSQERVFYEVEMPVLGALVAMEFEGVRLDASVLEEFGRSLAREMVVAEADIHRLAGHEFNVNSNRQLGEVLFEEMRLVEKPRKTPTGQYATDEQTLQNLADTHAIVRRLLDYRTVSKLKSTYADTLPAAIFPGTGRVHTTYYQAATATGRLSSMDPNLQNIPIRTDRGQEIRRAFVPREGWALISADYSQIELRIIAALSGEDAMIEAFRQGEDIHTSTAARVFGVGPTEVTHEMRRRAKMVNFGIAYGISAFGLAQRLGIPRSEAGEIISHYFASYPGIRRYMDETIAGARAKGYVETLTGRRRYMRDITSANATVRAAAERNAINMPIQGTAADMIKIAMANIHQHLEANQLQSRLLLQVHDELVFDLYPPEEAHVRMFVEEMMRTALPLPGGVPIVVEIGRGKDWLEAH